MADASLYVGFGLVALGVYLTWGFGPACLFVGAVLFGAGGMAARRAGRE